MSGARVVSHRPVSNRAPSAIREGVPVPEAEQRFRARERRVVAVRCGIRLASDPQALREVVEALGLTEEKAS